MPHGHILVQFYDVSLFRTKKCLGPSVWSPHSINLFDDITRYVVTERTVVFFLGTVREFNNLTLLSSLDNSRQ
jgi:hypothetical protein